jgi:hypothetical protein
LAKRLGEIGEATRVLVTFLPSTAPTLEQLGGANPDRETLRQRAFARMKQGMHLRGPPYPTREEFHDRFDG